MAEQSIVIRDFPVKTFEEFVHELIAAPLLETEDPLATHVEVDRRRERCKKNLLANCEEPFTLHGFFFSVTHKKRWFLRYFRVRVSLHHVP